MPFHAEARLPVAAARKAPRKVHLRSGVLKLGALLILGTLIIASLAWSHTSVHWLQPSSDGASVQQHVASGQTETDETAQQSSALAGHASSKHGTEDSDADIVTAIASSGDDGAALAGTMEQDDGVAEGDADEGQRDIVLHADAVAKVLEKARQRERERAQQQGDGQSAAGTVQSAERYKDLYNAAQGTVVFPPSTTADACPQGKAPLAADVVAAVVISTSTTPEALKNVLDALLQQMGQDEVRGAFHLYIVQEGVDKLVRQVALRYATETVGTVRFLQHVLDHQAAQPLPGDSQADHGSAAHQRFLLHTFFKCFQYKRLLLLDDALELAPDALSFFAGAAWLPDSDPTLWCISAWSDNGVKHVAADKQVLWRTDYHPGRAWMLSKNVGMQLLEQWPSTADWHAHLLLERVRHGRQCIVPEVPRARDANVQLHLNQESIDWSEEDLSILLSKEYDNYLAHLLASAPALDLLPMLEYDSTDACMLAYFTENDYAQAAKALRIAPPLPKRWRMPYCFDAGPLLGMDPAASAEGTATGSGAAKASRVCQGFLPRQAYRGVVIARNKHGVRVFLVSRQLAILLGKVQQDPALVANGGGSTTGVGTDSHKSTGQPLLGALAARHQSKPQQRGVLAGHTKLLGHGQPNIR